MRRLGTLSIVTVLVLGAGALLSRGLAQAPAKPDSPATRVAVCDVVALFKEYQKAKDLLAQLDTRGKQIKAEDANRAKEIQQLRESLGALVAGSKEYQARLTQMKKLTVERAVWQKLSEDEILADHRMLTEQMYREIVAAIEQVATERGFNVVIHRDSIDITSQTTGELLNKIALRKCLYAEASLDLTDAVLKRVNDTYQATKK